MHKTLAIIDPDLKDFRGHFFNYDSAVSKAAVGVFDKIQVLCSREFDGATKYGFEPVFHDPERFRLVRALRLFTGRAPSRDRKVNRPEERGCDWHGSFLNRSFRRFRSWVFARDLDAQLTANRDEGEQMNVFLQAEPFTLKAIEALVLSGKPWLKRTVFHWILRSGATFLCRSFEPQLSFAERLVRLAGCRSPCSCLYTDTHELADDYTALTNGVVTFTVLPIPLFMPEWQSQSRPAGDNSLRLSIMGVPRREKGFTLLPELARLLPAKLGGRRVVLQVQIDPHAGDPAIVEVEAELRRLAASDSGPEIRLWSGSIDPGEYAAWCASADISILLHNSPRYRLSSSSVFVESMHFGIPAVVFSGTWLAGVIVDAASAGLLIGETVDVASAIPVALEQLTGELEMRRKDTMEYYRRWSAANTPEQLVKILANAK